MLVDGRGVPLAAAVDGANVHDQKLLAATLDGIAVVRPEVAPYRPQHLCLDKGYTGEPVEQEVREARLHSARAGHGRPGFHEAPSQGKARRWKVERTHSWVNRARRLLIRWEKKVANYFGFLHLQFAIVALRTAGVLG